MPFWPPISLTNTIHSTLTRHGIPVVRTDHPSPRSQLSTTQRALLQNYEFEQYRRVDDKHERRTRIVLPKRPKKKKRPNRLVIVEPANKSKSASDSGSDSEGTLIEYPKIGVEVGIDIDVEIERKSRHHNRNEFSRASPRGDSRYCGVDVEEREPGRCRRQCPRQYQHRHRYRYRRHSADPYAGVDIEERRPRTRPGRGCEHREGMSSPSSSPSPPGRRVRFEGVEERSPGRDV